MVIEPMKYGPMKPGLMVIHSIGCPQPDPKYGPIKYRLMVFVPCKYLLPSLKYGHMKYGLMVIGYNEDRTSLRNTIHAFRDLLQ